MGDDAAFLAQQLSGSAPALAAQQSLRTAASRSASLTMAPLPFSAPALLDNMPGSGGGGAGAGAGPNGAREAWAPALSNVQTAGLALDTLAALIKGAVFLDEEAFSNAATAQLLELRLQAQQRRILQLEGEVEALRVEAALQQDANAAARGATRAAEARVQELQQELDNNAVVFKMHYQELLMKNEEIERLKSVIEGLGGGG